MFIQCWILVRPAISGSTRRRLFSGLLTVVRQTGAAPSFSRRVIIIRLRSGVELNFSHGATLHALPDASLYAKTGLETSGESHTPALILGNGLRHVAITGRGRIMGEPEFGSSTVTDNDTYPGWNETARRAGVPMDKPFVNAPKVSLIYLTECEDVNLSDVSIVDSPNWACHIQWSKRVRVTSVVITSSLVRGVNSNGLDIDGCQDVVVTGCVVTTSDDAICLKSTRQGGVQNPAPISWSTAVCYRPPPAP